MGDEFWTGFLAGCVVAGFVGWALAQIRWLLTLAGESGRQQQTTAYTKETPKRVTKRSCCAKLVLLAIAATLIYLLLALGRAALGG